MWQIVAMVAAIAVGVLGTLLLRRSQHRQRVAEDIEKDVEAKTSGWIARELQRRRAQTDKEALTEFERNFGKKED